MIEDVGIKLEAPAVWKLCALKKATETNRITVCVSKYLIYQ